MSAYVFVGPTLRPGEVRAACDVVCLPPIAQGDVWRLMRRRPRAIGIVDGYFEGAPSVWHKEILFALAEGVHVFGSASMGALRAAELHAFGMRGVGRIFEAYRDGRLTDDDEVAVLHGPAATGYVAVSEPMVNIRATLERAREEGIVGPGAAESLALLAKALFYQERSWANLLDRAAAGLPTAERDALRAWLPGGRVDLKRADALVMLAAMHEVRARDDAPRRVHHAFEWTGLWDAATADWKTLEPGGDDELATVPLERLLDEVRLEGPDVLPGLRRGALLRLLARHEADRRRLRADGEEIAAVLLRLRATLGLLTREHLEHWRRENDLTVDALESLVRDEARFEALEAALAPAVAEDLLDELRRRGDYACLAARARRKHELLRALDLDEAEPGAPAPLPAQLLAWYVERRLGRPLPEDVAALAGALGFASTDEFYRALAREYVYERQVQARGRPE